MKRRKTLAIAAAQVIFNSGSFRFFHDKESVIAFLRNCKDEVNTLCGKMSGEELAKIIENEEIDLNELNLRLQTYKRREKAREERNKFIADIVMIGEEYDVPVDVVELVPLSPKAYAFKIHIGDKTYLDGFNGTLDELKQVLSEEIERQASEMRKFMEIAQNNMLIQMKKIPGFSNFLDEINNHVHKSAIITFVGKSGVETWDINRRKNGFLTFGFSPSLWPKFYRHFIKSISEIGGATSVVLRSFTDKVHTATGLPIKELRGYKVFLRNNEFVFEQLTVGELIDAMNVDYKTGARLPPEPAVIYCGIDGQISSDDLIGSIKHDILEELRNNIKINLKEPINKTDIFRGLADLVYELYENNALNPRAFEKKLEKELSKFAAKGAHGPAGNLLYYIEYSKQLPAKMSKKLYGEY